jgi:propanediol dehydratase medium subunit
LRKKCENVKNFSSRVCGGESPFGANMNDELVKLITKKVIEAINAQNSGTSAERLNITEKGEAAGSVSPDEVVVALGASFSKDMFETISGISHYALLREVAAGIEEEGVKYRFIRVPYTSDAAFAALAAAKLSGSGIGVGIQSKGTVAIHQKGLFPLTDLELFSQAALITLDTYRKIGRNAARYAKGLSPGPVTVTGDCMARPKFHVKAAALHIEETANVNDGKKPVELDVEFCV